MSSCKAMAQEILSAARYRIIDGDPGSFYFEDSSLMGAVFAFNTVEHLLRDWEERQTAFLRKNSSALRGAPDKAWNLYCVLLTGAPTRADQEYKLASLEEDFRATRKIVRATVTNMQDTLVALLPLLGLQNEVALGVPDIEQDLRKRLDIGESAWRALFELKDPKSLAQALVQDT